MCYGWNGTNNEFNFCFLLQRVLMDFTHIDWIEKWKTDPTSHFVSHFRHSIIWSLLRLFPILPFKLVFNFVVYLSTPVHTRISFLYFPSLKTEAMSCWKCVFSALIAHQELLSTTWYKKREEELLYKYNIESCLYYISIDVANDMDRQKT